MAEKKILIVDYDTNNLDSMEKLFKKHKFQIIKATDGLSAYEQFKSEKPDIVIMEAILPKLHGFDLTRMISEETKKSVPVVIVTGLYKGIQYKHEAISSFGAAEYFEKPYDSEKLLNAVLALLNEETELGIKLPDTETIIRHLSEKLEGRPPGDEDSAGKKRSKAE